MRWISKRTVLEIHTLQILEHGGAKDIRDMALLESALARPRNLHEYEDTDLYRLAAAYAFGIIQNHPFIDGNKRTGLVVAATFLILNSVELIASEVETATMILEVAKGAVDENSLAEWFRANLRDVN